MTVENQRNDGTVTLARTQFQQTGERQNGQVIRSYKAGRRKCGARRFGEHHCRYVLRWKTCIRYSKRKKAKAETELQMGARERERVDGWLLVCWTIRATA